MSRVIALFNQAGGVCKTTLTMNLGYQLAQRQHSVLLVDLDPQASLTVFMGLEPADLEQTIADSILGDTPLPIQNRKTNLDLVPANLSLSAAELGLTTIMAREGRLKKALELVTDHHDYILIDCPPSLGILSILGLAAASHVLIPMQTHFKAYKGTELLLETIREVRQHINPGLEVAGIVPTLYVSNAAQDKMILASVQEQLSVLGRIYAPIPRATAFVDASMAGLALLEYQLKHPAVAILDEIAKGIEAL